MGPRSFAASFALLLLGASALAATGDALIVTGDNVNVRAGPSADAAVRMRVHRDQQVIELQREGSWVRAEIAGTDGEEGWIHSSLLAEPDAEAERPEDGASGESEAGAATTEAPSREQALPLMVEPAAGPTGDLSELARFRETVSYLNQRATALAGAGLFAKVEPGPEGAMRVVATETWSSLPPAGRQSYANTLLDRWAATKASAGPAVLQIVDPSGEVVMEKTRP
jgi:uncharacterized protein YgiM (DUF1202 family)